MTLPRLLLLLAVLLALTTTTTTLAQSTSASPSNSPSTAPSLAVNTDCSANTGCTGCVASGCAWGIGTCFSSCEQLPELPCYSLTLGAGASTSSSSSNTASSICEQQQKESQDAATCGIQTDCESCTGTPLTSINRQASDFEEGTPTACSWYEDQQKCANTACDSAGSCASPYCPSSREGQCYFGASTCLECLELDTPECSWSGGNCELNCVAETTCYSPALFPALDNTAICEASDNLEADTQLCSAQLDCASCTSAVKSDGTSCEYYFDIGTQSGWCGLGGCDANGLCGKDDCDGIPENIADIQCAALADERPQDVSCLDCLEADCGWTGTECLSSCDFLADANCWDTDSTKTDAIVCSEADEATKDKATCSVIEECDICTSTFKSDRRSTCEWYDDDEDSYCGVGGCDANGVCGSVRCPDDGTRGGCSTQDTCLSCLDDAADGCVWVGETCQITCSASPGDTCYSTASRPGSSVTAICNDAAFEESSNNGGGQVDTSSAVAVGSMMSLVMAVVGMLMMASSFSFMW